jgi:hypothetical protein
MHDLAYGGRMGDLSVCIVQKHWRGRNEFNEIVATGRARSSWKTAARGAYRTKEHANVPAFRPVHKDLYMGQNEARSEKGGSYGKTPFELKGALVIRR